MFWFILFGRGEVFIIRTSVTGFVCVCVCVIVCVCARTQQAVPSLSDYTLPLRDVNEIFALVDVTHHS